MIDSRAFLELERRCKKLQELCEIEFDLTQGQNYPDARIRGLTDRRRELRTELGIGLEMA